MNNLIIPNDYLYREERGNFVIGEVMKRSWASYLKILEEIKEICDKESLKIFACYGTLLGAVRDNGFIAWDDDIDLGLVRDDYVRFLDIISNEYEDKYRVLNSYTRPWFHMNFSHIINGKELNFEREHLKEWYGCPFMMGPDIYPYYYIPRNPEDEKYILQLLDKIDNTIALSKQSNEISQLPGNFQLKETVLKALTMGIYELQNETGYEFSNDRPIDNQLEILYDQVCRLTEESEADFVCRYDEYTVNKTKKFPKEYFKTTVPVKFEMTTIPVPIGYDEILKKRFGNSYIVPRREAAAHDYPFYKKQLNGKRFFEEQLQTQEARNSDFNNKLKSNKRKILYYTDIVNMLIHSNSAVETIKYVLKEYFDNNEYEFWWMPGIFPTSDKFACDEVAPEMINEYINLQKAYSARGGKICSISENYEYVVGYFDVYIGDEGDLAHLFREAKKNVIIQDYLSFQRKKTTEKDIESYEIPETWNCVINKKNGDRKKIVLYVNSISVLFQNQCNILEKIRKDLDIFEKKSEEIALFLYFPEIMEDIKCLFDKDFMINLSRLKESIDRKKTIIVDINQMETALEIADATFGDSDAIISACYKKGLPSMIRCINK